jgi:hypothetical protein
VKSGLSLEHRDLRNVSNTLGGRSGAVDQIHHRGIEDSVACSWKRNTLRHGWCLRVVSASLSAEMNWLLSSLHSVAALHGTRLPNEGCFGRVEHVATCMWLRRLQRGALLVVCTVVPSCRFSRAHFLAWRGRSAKPWANDAPKLTGRYAA